MNKEEKRFSRKKIAAIALTLCAVLAIYANVGLNKKYNSDVQNQTKTSESIEGATEAPAAQADANKNAGSYNWEEDENVTKYVRLPVESEDKAEIAAPQILPSEEVSAADPEKLALYDDTAEEEISLGWPLEGKTVLSYSTDKTVFDPTLEQYRTNDSIWLAAAEGSLVSAAGDGVVDFVGENPRFGKMVSISHESGFRTTYAQLKDVAVTEGESVAKGETIGSVAKTNKYGAATGDHLEFWVYMDDVSLNPDVVIG